MRIITKATCTFTRPSWAPGGFAMVVPANCEGILRGKFVLSAAEYCPEWAERYRSFCGQAGGLQPGDVIPHYGVRNRFPIWLSLAISHWREKPRLSDVRKGLETICKIVNATPALFPGLIVPPLGIKWSDVSIEIYETLGLLKTDVWVFKDLILL